MSCAYTADVTPTQAYKALQEQDDAVLVDVRTTPELIFIGQPKISKMASICWQDFPQMELNPEFITQIERAGLTKDHKIYFLCRTGGRSAAAAAALSAQGYPHCYNILSGFEGELDANAQRGNLNGWKAEGLPWYQR